MRVWRICRKPFSKDVLAGRGGLFASGRWHGKGGPVVYMAESRALAALEVLVHVDREMAPSDLVQIEIEIPDDLSITKIGIEELPRNWNSYPSPAALQAMGDGWLAAEETPVLQVPSAVISEETNFLLNPQHADAERFEVVSTRRFSFDFRLTE